MLAKSVRWTGGTPGLCECTLGASEYVRGKHCGLGILGAHQVKG